MIVVTFMIIALFFGSMRLKPSVREAIGGEIYLDGFNKENTQAIRGFLAIGIALSHCGIDFRFPTVISTLITYGLPMFFFFSGYNLTIALKKQENFKQFAYKKFRNIILPYLIISIVYFIVLPGIFRLDIKRVLECISPFGTAWFVYVILLFYLIFWVCFRKAELQNKKSTGLCLLRMSILIVAYFILMYVFAHDKNMIYKTCLSFIPGVAFGLYKNEVESFLSGRSIRYRSLVLCGIGFYLLATYIPGMYNRILGEASYSWWIFQHVLISFSIIGLNLLLMYKASFANRITNYIGSISYELYLCHMMVIVALQQIWAKDTMLYQELFPVAVIVLSVIIASALHHIIDILKRIIY